MSKQHPINFSFTVLVLLPKATKVQFQLKMVILLHWTGASFKTNNF